VRAFLSHSSSDKGVVDQVANGLKRSRVWLDQMNIETASDIRDALLRGLESSDVFVLFASMKALKSDWVKWEVNIAERQLLAGKLSRICAFLIDDEVKVRDLPPIFHRVHVRAEKSPKIIAQEIVRVIQESAAQARQSLFVGRADELSECGRRLAGTNEQVPPAAILLFGLEGVGRRALLGQFARNSLGLPTRIEIAVAPGDGLSEIIVFAENALGVRTIESEIAERLDVLRNEQNESVMIQILAELISASSERQVILALVDQGGLIDEEGTLPTWAYLLADSVSQQGNGQFAIISRRRPTQDNSSPQSRAIPYVRVPELLPEDSAQLLTALLRQRQVRFSAVQLKQLVEHTSGYPPAAYYAAEIAKQDGLDMLLANTAALGKVTEARFLRTLETDQRLDPARRDVLRLLANYSPLPLKVIADYMGLEADEFHACMQYLLDIGVIYPADIHYKIAEPVVRAVSRLYGTMSVNHGKFAELVSDYLEEMEDDDPGRLPLVRHHSRAVQFSGVPERRANPVRFASDQIEVAMRLYHSRDYERAIKVAEEALAQTPHSIELRDYLIRSLIQLERYTEADKEIAHLSQRGATANAAFLSGFALRRRGQYADALKHYQRAINLGRRGAAIHRELAQCYFEVGDYESARAHIEQAERADPDNRFVVDLKCQVATKLGRESDAMDALAVLEYVDRRDFFLHRKSVVLAKFGHQSGALNAAQEAYKVSSGPSFEILAQLVNLLIEAKLFDDARLRLEELDARHKGIRKDIRLGLRCKLLTARGELNDALAVWDQLARKDKPVHRRLKLQVLLGLRDTGAASPAQIAEIDELRSEPDSGIWDPWEAELQP